MSTMTRFDQLGALFSEDCATPTRMANRGFTIAGAPTVWVSARGKTLTYFDGSDDKATWVGRIGTVKSISFWFICKSNNEQFFDFDGGTHTIDSAVGVIRANGWTTPTIYVDGVATGNYSLNVLHHCVITSATGFDASSFKIGTDNTSYGAVAIADVVLFGTVVTAAEALLLATDKLFRYDESLVSDWDFSTINPRDRKGTNNGTGTGLVAATDVVPWQFGGSAIELNGTDELVNFGSDTSLDDLQIISVVIDMKLTSTAVAIREVWRKSTSFRLYLSNGGLPQIYRAHSVTGMEYSATTALSSVDKPYCVAWCMSFGSGGSAKIYLEGEDVTSLISDPDGTATSDAGSSCLLGTTGTGYWLPAIVGVGRVYSSKLTQLQVKDMMRRIRQGR